MVPVKRKSTDISIIINVRKEQLMKKICVYKSWKIYFLVINQLEKHGYLWHSGHRLYDFIPSEAPLYLFIHKEFGMKYITFHNRLSIVYNFLDNIGINELLSNKAVI